MAKTKEWKTPNGKQPVWRVIRNVFVPFFKAKTIVYEGEQLPEKCIIVSNHNNKKGPMVFEINLPIIHATWGAYQMLGTYNERFHYLRDVFYMQKNGVGKFKATLRAGFEALFSIYIYKGMKILPSYPDVRFRKTLQYSMNVLDAGYAVSMYPEDSNQGYFEEMTHFFSGFVMLAQQYYTKTGEDVPVFPVYWGRNGNKLIVGKPLYVQDLVKEGLNRDEIADRFRLEVNGLYKRHFNQ